MPRALPVARARDGVQPHVVGPPLRVDPGRDHPHALPFEHRKGRAPEVEDEVVDVGVARRVGDAMVRGHHRAGRTLGGMQAHVGVRGAPRGRHTPHARRGHRGDRGDLVGHGVARGGEVGLRGELVPRELRREVPGRAHVAPGVDGARRAGGQAVAAGVAEVGLHHVVATVVGDRVARARLLAGVAADADLGVDEVLTEQRRRGHHAKRTYSKSTPLPSMPRGGGAIQFA